MGTIVVHGGAGALSQELKENKGFEKRYREALKEATNRGLEKLDQDFGAEEAVETAIIFLEDCELFNSGKGAALNHKGDPELDAGFASGDGAYGGVGLIRGVKNPIQLARLVKNKCPHFYLFGEGAIDFAKQENLEFKDDAYFKTAKSIAAWEKAVKDGGIFLDGVSDKDVLGEKTFIDIQKKEDPSRFGTVGAVAYDNDGNLVAGTSTGGLNNKWVGRVGDTPLLGSGTFAHYETCAISATGKGEEMIKIMFASQVHFLMKYKKKNLYEALKLTVDETMPKNSIGAVSVDQKGRPVFYCNTEGMFSCFASSEKFLKVVNPIAMIFQEEIKETFKNIKKMFK